MSRIGMSPLSSSGLTNIPQDHARLNRCKLLRPSRYRCLVLYPTTVKRIPRESFDLKSLRKMCGKLDLKFEKTRATVLMVFRNSLRQDLAAKLGSDFIYDACLPLLVR